MTGRRLDTVLRVRRLQERVARGQVATERRREDEQRRRHESLATAIDQIDVAPGTDAPGLTAHRVAVETGIRAYLQAGIDVGHAQRRVAASLDEWQITAQRQEGVERLDARLTEADRADATRRESVEIDDLVIAGWGRRPR